MLAPRLLLLALLGMLGCLPSQAPQRTEQGKNAGQEQGHVQGHEGQHADKSTLQMSDREIFDVQHSHSVPHAVFPHVAHGEEAPAWAIYNVNVWQGIALALVFGIMLLVSNSFHRQGQPGWLVRVFRGFCRWVRDEMVYSVMGKEEGRAWVPFFLFLFFFVCAQNVLGLIPSIPGVLEPTTATSTPYVTGALGIITFGLMLGFGMKKNGVFGYWKGLLPHGLPVGLIPLMLPIELIGLVVKPFALTVRLFANMLAGHLVIASSIGLIYVFAKMFHGGALTYLTAVPAVGMAVFIYIIESFVVLLQAYIFTYLSIIFVHAAMHQDH
jgi:F-type H+-transporting ATPase subunit a